MINPSSLRQQPRPSSVTAHRAVAAAPQQPSDGKDTLFYSNVDHDLDICKSCAATMSENFRRILPPFEAVTSFDQRNRNRPATAGRLTCVFCDVCGGVVHEGPAPGVETKVSVAIALQATSLAGQLEAIALACRHFPWPAEIAREPKHAVTAFARAGMEPSVAQQLTQLLIDDEKRVT